MNDVSPVLTGRKAISLYLGVSWGKVEEWIKRRKLPATKLDGTWISERSLLRQWVQGAILNAMGTGIPPDTE